MNTNPLFDFSHLSPAEPIQIAHDLWDSIESEEIDTELRLTDAQRAELDHCLEDLPRDPGSGAPWSEMRERIERQLRPDPHSKQQRRGT